MASTPAKISLALIFALCTSVNGQQANKTECDAIMYKADKCILDISMVGQKSAPVPRTEEDMNFYCGNVNKKTIPCVRKFTSKCLTPFPRTLFSVGYKLGMAQFRKFCFTPEGRREYMSHVECFKPEHIQIGHRYMDIVTMYADHVAQNVSADQIVPYLCCAYFTIYEDATTELTKICPREQTINFFVNIVKSVATDMVDVGCGRYSSSDTCRKLMPQAMDVYDKLSDPKVLRRSPGYSPMVPLVKIMRKLDA